MSKQPKNRFNSLEQKIKELNNTKEGMINLRTSDNGQGFPDGFSPREPEHFGLLTVFSIVEGQLDGKIEYSTDEGITWSILFKDKLYEKRV